VWHIGTSSTFRLVLDPEDGGSTLLRNVGCFYKPIRRNTPEDLDHQANCFLASERISRLLCNPKVMVAFKFAALCNIFLRWGTGAPCPTTKLEYYCLSTIRNCLPTLFAAAVSLYLKAVLYAQPADARITVKGPRLTWIQFKQSTKLIFCNKWSNITYIIFLK
jgi:hypothetical protein